MSYTSELNRETDIETSYSHTYTMSHNLLLMVYTTYTMSVRCMKACIINNAYKYPGATLIDYRHTRV